MLKTIIHQDANDHSISYSANRYKTHNTNNYKT